MKCDETKLLKTTLDITRHQVHSNKSKSDSRYSEIRREILISRRLILFFGIAGIVIQIVKEAV